MFEQSMLLDAAPGKKAGALALSLTLQAVGIGTLLLIPLIYTNRLQFTPLTLPTFLPLSRVPLSETPVTKQSPTTDKNSFHPRREIIPFIFNWSTVKRPDSSAFIGDQPPNIGDMPIGLTINTGTVIPHVDIVPPPPALLVPNVTPVVPTVPLRVTSEMISAKNIRKVLPIYPRLAITTRVSGTVRLMGIIAKDGTIQQLQVVSGHPLLVKAAVEAVSQWLYTPTVLNGQAVEVIAPIDVVFTLAQ